MPTYTLNTPLELHNAAVDPVIYMGRSALRVIEVEPNQGAIVILTDSDFKDGIIETEIAGLPAPGAIEGARGFVGIAFRMQPERSRYEGFYLRPTNGRANDQLRRNHATQYIGMPDFPWYRLREETPGVYESYVDLVTGAWTTIKIVVAGQSAALYVHGAEQPCLIVNDLKNGATAGQIAFWIGAGTEAYFTEIVTR